MTLQRLLTPEDVAARYGYRDLRAARRVMYLAGAMRIGNRLFIRADVLDQYERDATTRARVVNTTTPRPARALPRPTAPAAPLEAEWWRTPVPDATSGPGNHPRRNLDAKGR